MRATVVVPGPLDLPTGGYVYDRHIVHGLRQEGWGIELHELDDSFPVPTDDAQAEAVQAITSQPDGGYLLVDGLLLGSVGHVIAREAHRLPIVALVHLPLNADVSLPFEPQTVAWLRESERRALEAVAQVVVTGRAGRTMLEACGVAHDRIAVVEPGTDAAPLARGSEGGPLQLLSVGTVSHVKGHDHLLEALASVPDSRWHLTCVGSTGRDRQSVDRVKDLMRRFHLEERVTLTGHLAQASLAAQYDRADLFVLASRQETYGMAVAEALARGLPVVATATGAIPDLVGVDSTSRAGLLVPPGDVAALTAALGQVVKHAEVRRELAAGARAARDRLHSWDRAVSCLSTLLTQLPALHRDGDGTIGG